ncbi:hypothetical protein GGX14DRAFT_645690 [Mycena pura]|uniref:Uncharacterized protein n=1 Tax=Mycena pura TaxID=153505 RepID=A0AAD6V9Y5_9AGAR|nr:hypothetical protein GGX14DRAFT_645690 [Mycena pura]
MTSRVETTETFIMKNTGTNSAQRILICGSQGNASRHATRTDGLLVVKTCTLGLHGPWGESSSVFIRITFTFPKDYPHRIHPRGTPTVELERNPLISLKNRAFILRRLRTLRERQRPCLEACLRFLSEGETSGLHSMHMDSESSDSDEQRTGRKARNGMMSLIRSHKNLTEPRRSQGTFGPNGSVTSVFQLLVNNVLWVLSSPAKTVSDIPPSHDSIDLGPERPPLRRFRSPSLIADAVRRLRLSATDRVVKPLDARQPQAGGDHILRIMTNILTFSHDTPHHRESERESETRTRLTHPAPRRRTVFITNTSHISGGDARIECGVLRAFWHVFVPKILKDCGSTAAPERKQL